MLPGRRACGMHAAFGWWWADEVAALLVLPAIRL
jgi:divalent metal cation (Fe/Co/Zn/Cd) transporter